MTRRKPAPKPTEHVVLHIGKGSRIQCLHCGSLYAVVFPAPVTMVTKAWAAFEKDHTRCPKPAEGVRCMHCLKLGHASHACEEMHPKTLDAWRSGPDTGTSARTLLEATVGGGGLGDHRPGSPRDADDFGRCYRLLASFPELRAMLGAVAATYPEWVPLVREWTSLEALYREEIPNGEGKAPKLNEAIRKCHAEAGRR